jgi:osmotically-inducible protein OsmY
MTTIPFRTRRPLWALTLCAGALCATAACYSSARSAPTPVEAERRALYEAGKAADLRIALLDKLGSDALNIEARLQGRRAVLTGQVRERATQELAEQVALSVRGVRNVDNRLTLQSGGIADSPTPVGAAVVHAEKEVRDATLQSRVTKNVLGEVGRYGLEITVESTDGVVSLRGNVPDAIRKKLALDAAGQTSGVVKVIDLLEIAK